MSRLNFNERRLIVRLLEKEIESCLIRLNPNKDSYIGPILHDGVEARILDALLARNKVGDPLPENMRNFRVACDRYKPVISSNKLRTALGLFRHQVKND